MGEILSVKVGGTSYADTARKTIEWAKQGESRAVFFANVHVIMEAHDDPRFRAELNRADLVNPDGVPLVWALHGLGEKDVTRVYGPDATEILLQQAADNNLPVGFYGGTQGTLDALEAEVRRRHPSLPIVFSMSPPFREITAEEDEEIVRRITASGARMLFVGLGCPRQERWVMAHVGRVPAVMLAVGAAFDFIANTKPQAPRWMMRNGLEWLFRLASEPRRLAVRYLKHNPRFMGLIAYQILSRPRPSA